MAGMCLMSVVLTSAGKYLALKLTFNLPASCYATMLIRELTKQPSSKAFHRALQHE